MHFIQLFDCFQFYDYKIIHKQVYSVADFNFDSVIYQRQLNLYSNLEAGFSEFMCKTSTICIFQQPWP